MDILNRVVARKVIICLCLFFCSCHVTLANEEPPLQLYEQKIKAGLVYNLLKYTTWPAPADDKEKKPALKVCVFGDDPFDGYLSPLQGHTAQQASILIIHIKQIKDATRCNVVIIHHDEEEFLPGLLQFLNGKNILTISDIEQFARHGGMVELAKEGDKINLYINKNALDRGQLIIDERMLRLAKVVNGEALQ